MRRFFNKSTSLLAGSFLWGNLALALAPSHSRPVGAIPFSIGEKLIYAVEWNPPWYLFFLPTMQAGEAELSLAGETVHNDRRALKIVFKARSSGALVKLMGVTVNDHFEFVTDPDTFCTFSVSKKIQEGKRKREIQVLYHPEERRLHIREIDLATRPPVVKRDEFVEKIPACVKDLFSALYAFRREEIGLGMSHREVVGDNARVKEIKVHVEKNEIVKTPTGTYQTYKINTEALLGGLFKDGGQFRVWLTADERKLPVQFEAKVNLGMVSGKLKSMER